MSAKRASQQEAPSLTRWGHCQVSRLPPYLSQLLQTSPRQPSRHRRPSPCSTCRHPMLGDGCRTLVKAEYLFSDDAILKRLSGNPFLRAPEALQESRAMLHVFGPSGQELATVSAPDHGTAPVSPNEGTVPPLGVLVMLWLFP